MKKIFAIFITFSPLLNSSFAEELYQCRGYLMDEIGKRKSVEVFGKVIIVKRKSIILWGQEVEGSLEKNFYVAKKSSCLNSKTVKILKLRDENFKIKEDSNFLEKEEIVVDSDIKQLKEEITKNLEENLPPSIPEISEVETEPEQEQETLQINPPEKKEEAKEEIKEDIPPSDDKKNKVKKTRRMSIGRYLEIIFRGDGID
jgi:hypothetical protein